MKVSELIEQLQKVEDEDAEVYLSVGEMDKFLDRVVLERDLADDEYIVILKP